MIKTERSKRGIGIIDIAVCPTLRSVIPTQIFSMLSNKGENVL